MACCSSQPMVLLNSLQSRTTGADFSFIFCLHCYVCLRTGTVATTGVIPFCVFIKQYLMRQIVCKMCSTERFAGNILYRTGCSRRRSDLGGKRTRAGTQLCQMSLFFFPCSLQRGMVDVAGAWRSLQNGAIFLHAPHAWPVGSFAEGMSSFKI